MLSIIAPMRWLCCVCRSRDCVGVAGFLAQARLGSSGALGFCAFASSRIPVMRQLLDVLHHAVQLPLPLDLVSAAQGEAVHLLVAPYIAEHRLHRGKAPGDDLAAALRADLALHAITRCFFRAGVLARENGHLSDDGSLRVAQALGS